MPCFAVSLFAISLCADFDFAVNLIRRNYRQQRDAERAGRIILLQQIIVTVLCLLVFYLAAPPTLGQKTQGKRS